MQFLSVIAVLESQIGEMRVERREATSGVLRRQWLDWQVLAALYQTRRRARGWIQPGGIPWVHGARSRRGRFQAWELTR
jgi:hypothetical protein